jgi:Insertion element 4 transposase N-terminal
VIAKFLPAEKIREVLEQTRRASVRERDLPAHVVVYGRAAAKTGADLLWRTRQNAGLDVEKRLPLTFRP